MTTNAEIIDMACRQYARKYRLSQDVVKRSTLHRERAILEFARRQESRKTTTA